MVQDDSWKLKLANDGSWLIINHTQWWLTMVNCAKSCLMVVGGGYWWLKVVDGWPASMISFFIMSQTNPVTMIKYGWIQSPDREIIGEFRTCFLVMHSFPLDMACHITWQGTTTTTLWWVLIDQTPQISEDMVFPMFNPGLHHILQWTRIWGSLLPQSPIF